MKSYLDYIDNVVGLSNIGDQESIIERLEEIKTDRVIDFQQELANCLPRPVAKDSKYRFIANSELSGLPYPCSSFSCRGRALRQSMLFSAAYADEIVLFNPFQFLPTAKYGNAHYFSQMAFHISEILSMSKLIDRGLITFTDFNQYSFCRNCFRKGLSAATGIAEDGDFYFMVARDIIDKSDVTYDYRSKDGYHFTIDTESLFYGHPRGSYTTRKKKPFMSLIKKGDHLSRDQVEEIGLSISAASFASNDIIQVNALSDRIGVSNVFMSRPQKTILREYFGTEKIGGDIEVSYPFLARAGISEILSFRDNEWHHLHDYRQFVDTCIRESKSVGDQLEGEFAKLKAIVDKADRQINKKLMVDGAILAANLTAAVATSGLSTLLSGILALLGSGHFATKIVPDLVEKFSESEAARDSKVFYAWRLTDQKLH